MNESVYHIKASRNIIEFNQMKLSLLETYPDYTMKQYREYIISGINKDGFSDELCQILEHMKEIREQAIAYEMQFDQDIAETEGKQIKEEYLTGRSLDLFFSLHAVEEYNFFGIFKDMSWYDPIEEAQIALTEPLKDPFEASEQSCNTPIRSRTKQEAGGVYMKLGIQPLIDACEKSESGGLSLEKIARGDIGCLASPRYALTWKERDTVEIVDVETNEVVGVIENVWKVERGWTDDLLIVVYHNRMVRLHSIATKQDLLSVGPLDDVAFDPDRERMVGINVEGEAVLYDLKSGEILAAFASDKGAINSVKYNPSGEYVVATVNTSAFVLDRDALQYVRRIDYHEQIWSLDINPDKHFASINTKLFNIENGGRKPVELTISDEKKLEEYNREKSQDPYDYDEWDYSVAKHEKCFSFSTDSRYLAMVADVESSEYNQRDGRYFTGTHSKIFVFDAHTMKELCILDDRVQLMREGYKDAVFCPDGQYLMARRPDGIKLWRSETWELCVELRGDNLGVAFSRDGKYLVIEQ